MSREAVSSGSSTVCVDAEWVSCFTEIYLHRMAAELAATILAGHKLRLGSIWDESERPAQYRFTRTTVQYRVVEGVKWQGNGQW